MDEACGGGGASSGGGGGGGSEDAHFAVVFAGSTYDLLLPVTASVADLRSEVEETIGVAPPQQRFVGWPPKGTPDDALLSALPRKSPQRVLLMGTRADEWEAARAAAAAAAVGEDEDAEGGDDAGGAGGAVPPHLDPVNLQLIAKRVGSFRPLARAGFRPGCWTAVLDIDYTLIDHKSPVERIADLARPYLHFFLATLFEQRYDLVIWSATTLRWAVLKMQALGVDRAGAGAGDGAPPAFVLAGYMHRDAMVPVHGCGDVLAKPLAVMWGQCPETRPDTTVMLDDCRSSLLLNPEQGLRVRPCRDLPHTRGTDRELLHLAVYFALVRRGPSLRAAAPHRKWRARLRLAGYDTAVASDADAVDFIAALPPLPPPPPPPGAGAAGAAPL